MKKIYIIILATVLSVLYASEAVAQIRFGVVGGVNLNHMKFDDKLFDSDNRVGFTAGAMVELLIPDVGFGVDASLMFVRNNSEVHAAAATPDFAEEESFTTRDYFQIPVNLKYKMMLPAIEHVVRPYIFTGPVVSFLTSRRAITDALHNKGLTVSWTIGAGVELFRHLQVAASYGLGMTDALETVDGTQQFDLKGKNHVWTVTMAYVF